MQLLAGNVFGAFPRLSAAPRHGKRGAAAESGFSARASLFPRFHDLASAVDAELVERWIELFVLQNRIEFAHLLLQKCTLEPRFREAQRRAAGLAPFWGIGELHVRIAGIYEV